MRAACWEAQESENCAFRLKGITKRWYRSSWRFLKFVCRLCVATRLGHGRVVGVQASLLPKMFTSPTASRSRRTSPLRTGLPQAPRVLFLWFCSSELGHLHRRLVHAVKEGPGKPLYRKHAKIAREGLCCSWLHSGMPSALSELKHRVHELEHQKDNLRQS